MIRRFFDPANNDTGNSGLDWSSFRNVENSNSADSTDNSESEESGESAEGDESGENSGEGDSGEGENKPSGETPGENKPTAEAGTDKPTVTDWREAIKGVDVKEVLSALGDKRVILKDLGLSDFVINLNDHYESTGNAKDYLAVADIDYEKMDADALILAGIRLEEPKAPEAVIQKLFKKELEKYETDPEQFDADTVAYGNFMKEKKAAEFKAKLIEHQQKFTIPKKEVNEHKVDPKVKEQEEATIKFVSESDVTKTLLQSKSIKIGDAKNAYNFEVKDAQELVDIAMGNKNFFSLFGKADGTVDLELFYATVAFAKDRKGYDSAAIGHGKTLANKAQIDDDDAVENEGQPSGVKPLSGWAALQKNGREMRYEY